MGPNCVVPYPVLVAHTTVWLNSDDPTRCDFAFVARFVQTGDACPAHCYTHVNACPAHCDTHA